MDVRVSRPTAVLIGTRVFTPEPIPAAFRQEALALALESVGADVTVLTTVPPSGTQGAAAAQRVKRFPVKRDSMGQVRGYASYMSFDIPLFLRILLARRVDAVVAEPPPTTGLFALVAATIRRAPLIFYAADVWSDAAESVGGVPRFVLRAVRWMETTVWKRSAAVLTISPGVQKRLEELVGPRGSFHMIGNGVDTDVFTPDGPLADDRPSAPYFLYAGTVSEWQGADVLVEGFAQLADTHPEAQFIFFSEGTGRDELEAMVTERGIAGVQFRGRAPASVVAASMRGAAAGVSSITPGLGYEFALPTKMYAASACGTPIIHAGEGAANELVSGNSLGWAVEYTPDAVAAAMRAALDGDRPTREHLRAWTEEHASLRGCARKGAEAVLRAVREQKQRRGR